MIYIELFEGWLTANLEPCYWGNMRRYENYMAIINGMDDEGKEIRTFLQMSKESDLYFHTKGVNVWDIIVASNWDTRHHRQTKRYYIVRDITDERITLQGEGDMGLLTTYRKAKKTLDKIKQSDGLRHMSNDCPSSDSAELGSTSDQ